MTKWQSTDLTDAGISMGTNYEIKRRIARLAATMVEDGETILLESGSCCAMLAEELANNKQVTIITNSVYITSYIRNAPFAKVILLGGEYQNRSQIVVGAMTAKWAEIFISDKLFIGTNGFTERYGFTGWDHLRSQTARDMVQQAKQIIVLTDSDKFLKEGSEGIVRTEQVSDIFTDDRIPPETEAFFLEKNVKVHKVPSSTM